MAEKSRSEGSFEEIMKKLEETAEKLKEDDVPLEKAIKYYEEGIKYYDQCRDILEKANQKIEVLSKREVLDK